MTWPIVEGVSLLLPARQPRASAAWCSTSKHRGWRGDLPRPRGQGRRGRRGDAPGRARRRGLGFDALSKENPKIVFVTISGYGMTGPVPRLPEPRHRLRHVGRDRRPRRRRRRVHLHARARLDRHQRRPALRRDRDPRRRSSRARETGHGCQLEIAQSDAAAAFDWYRIETWRAYERPEDEVTGNKSDDYERRAPGTAGMKEGVRYQIYESSRRLRAVHGLASRRSGRTSARRSAGWTSSRRGPARSTPTTRAGNTRAAGRAARHLPDEDLSRVDGARRAR